MRKKRQGSVDNEDEDIIDDIKSGVHSLDSRKSRSSSKAPPAKKKKGDSKAGGVQPYSYLPLDPKLLNKRTNKKAAGQFKSIVTAAKKGSHAAQPRRRR